MTYEIEKNSIFSQEKMINMYQYKVTVNSQISKNRKRDPK